MAVSEEPEEPTEGRAERGPRPADVLGVVVPALTLVVVLAAAAPGGGLLAPGADRDGGMAWVVRLAGAGLAAFGIGVLLTLRRRGWDLGPDGLLTVLVVAGTLFLLLTVLTVPFSDVTMTGSADRDQVTTTTTWQLDPPTTEPDPTTTPTTAPRRESLEDGDSGLALLLALLLLAVLGVVAVLGVLRAWGIQPRWQRRGQVLPPEPEAPPVDAESAEAGLTASLAAVVAGDDARAAIIRAYAALLDALAEAGGPRRPQEAPHEHLYRVLGPLGVRPDPVHGLAELFVMAKFSSHPVTEEHRSDAVAWLEAALDDLRTHTAVSATSAADPDTGPR